MSETDGPETNGLRDPLAGNLGYQLRRASAMVMADFGEALAAIGLRVGEASILLVLADNPGTTQSDVGKLLGIQRANMAPLITGLERRGLIERDDSEGRAQPLRVSAAGGEMAARVRAISDSEDARLVAVLGEGAVADVAAALKRLRGMK